MEGTTLAHFRILAKIGEGGMGVVYRAEDINLRRPVALKVLPPDVVGNEERRARFLREARAAAAVPHPNIATIYEIGEADGVVFIAMELVEGTTLRSRLGTGALMVKDAVQIANQIAEGLAGAHQSRVVHRDLKPENVAITPAGHVKILDFGLAKLLHDNVSAAGHGLTALRTISGEMTNAGKILGTTTYMSPEQARGEAIDARSDIFSFGTLLYEMVTGRAPFQGRTSTDVLSSIIRDQPTPAAEINPSVPPELQRIIAECLEKDPHDRYQHTDQLVVDLRKLTRSTDSAAPVARTASGVGSAAPRTRWLGRLGNRTRRGIFIGAAACLLLAGGFGAWQAFRSEPGFDRREGIIVADFENTTGRPVFDTAVRDAFEQLLSRSTFVDVIRGDRLKSVLGGRPQDPVPALGRQVLQRACAGGKCAFIIGRIEPEGGSFRLEVDLFRAGRSRPIFTRSAAVRSEQECLGILHEIGIDLRRAAGEAPGAIALTGTPTTRSLAAFQAYASAEIEAGNGRSDVALGLHRRAVTLDPDFVDAYKGLSYDYANVGDWRAARASAEQAWRRSVRLPEHRRLMAEILYLDTQYDFASEIDLLKSCRRLYPYDEEAANLLGVLYTIVLEDHVSAEPHLRAAYQIKPSFLNLEIFTGSLQIQGKGEELVRVAQDYRVRTGQEPAVAVVKTLAVRRDWKAMLEALDRFEREGTLPGTAVAGYRAWTHIMSGRLREAQTLQEIARREELKEGTPIDLSTLNLMWLNLRLGRPVALSQEDVARAAKALLSLRWWAVFAVEANIQEPLASLVATLQEMERGSQSSFIREELQFARGCLALVRGDLKAARRLIEPLADNTEVPHRSQVLAHLYEAHRMWPEAAARYEVVVNHPNLMAFGFPGLWNLDRFRLAQVYERLGDTVRARALYERFAGDWRDGDADIPELAAARQRLAALGGADTSSH